MASSYIKLASSDIKEGMRFSEDVYFDDGKSLFLPATQAIKPYHLAAIKSYGIQYFLTSGQEIDDVPLPEL